jgi:hypothetical protein
LQAHLQLSFSGRKIFLAAKELANFPTQNKKENPLLRKN